MRLDIVIPVHNEEARIGPMLEAYRAFCPDPATRFVVALDRCSDHTPDIVWANREADPRVEIVHSPKLAKGGLLREAFRRCNGDLVGLVDAGGATPPGELLRLAEAAQRADGALASSRRRRPFVMRRDVVEQALPLLSSRPFLFDLGLIELARRMGRDVVEVPTTASGKAGSPVRAFAGALCAAVAVRLWLRQRGSRASSAGTS